MGERYQKAFVGKPFSMPAAIYNDMLDMVKWWKVQSGHTGAGTPPTSHRSQNTIMVRNDSGADADERFSVLGIDDIVFTPTDNERGFQNEPLLSVVTPTVADHLGKFVITQQPLRNGKLCRAVATGLTPVKIDVVNEDDEWADVKDGDATQLQSGPSGSAKILWKESGTGTKWALVSLGTAPVASQDATLIKITAAVQDSTNYRWEYTCRLMTPQKSAGFTGWTEADETDYTARNLVERDNGDGSGGPVSGIDLGADVTGIAPAPIGLIVPATWIPTSLGGGEYWFSWANHPIVECLFGD